MTPDLSRIDRHARRQRGVTVADLFPGEPGRCACGCGATLSGRRRRWASDRCASDAVAVARLHMGDLHTIRAAVFERDGGVCALCGFDCDRAARLLRRLDPLIPDARLEPRFWRAYTYLRRLGYTDGALRGFNPGWRAQNVHRRQISAMLAVEMRGPDSPRTSLWDADHIVPVEHGGGGCGLDGYRTLCIPCHVAVTARQNRGRAALPSLRP